MSSFDSQHPKPARSSELSLRPELAREMESLLGRVPCCPHCDVNLIPTDHSTGLAWRCPQCAGSSLNFGQFRHLIPEMHADEIWLTMLYEPAPAPQRARCPECRKNMSAVLIPFQGKEIELDICQQCQRVWMESEEKRRPRRIDSVERIDISENAPIRKPPIVSLAGRMRRSPLGEKMAGLQADLRLKSRRINISKSDIAFTIALILMGALLRSCLYHYR